MECDGDAPVLPLPRAQLIAVEYPGFVVNPSRALHTLGGAEAIRKAEAEGLEAIDVCYEPEVPSAASREVERARRTRAHHESAGRA